MHKQSATLCLSMIAAAAVDALQVFYAMGGVIGTGDAKEQHPVGREDGPFCVAALDVMAAIESRFGKGRTWISEGG